MAQAGMSSSKARGDILAAKGSKMRAYRGQWRERKGFSLVVSLYLTSNLAGPVADDRKEINF